MSPHDGVVRDEGRFGGLPRAPVGVPPCVHAVAYEPRAYAIVCDRCGHWWTGEEVRAARSKAGVD